MGDAPREVPVAAPLRRQYADTQIEVREETAESGRARAPYSEATMRVEVEHAAA